MKTAGSISKPAFRHRRRHRHPAATDDAITDLTFEEVAHRMVQVLGGGGILLLLGVIVGTVFLTVVEPDYAWPFALIGAVTCGGMQFWRVAGGKGVPLLPVLLIQQGVIYAVPLVMRNESLQNYSRQTLELSVIAVVISLVVACVVWRLASTLIASKPSRFNISLGKGSVAARRSLGLALAFLICGIAFELLCITKLVDKILPSIGLFPVLRTFATGAGSLGALFGGLSLGSSTSRIRRTMFWALFFVDLFLAARGLILAGTVGLLSGVTIGLVIALRRLPWGFLLFVSALLAFLNFGKFPMREKYSNASEVGLSELPAFYLEWANQSLRLMNVTQIGSKGGEIIEEGEQGQSMLMRMDNLQNLMFFVRSLEDGALPPLKGETYFLIPPLLIPRYLWPDKPRAHEGQVLLNVYFGRQANVEETENTYISIGLLPEAIGNFGPIPGALFFGLVTGLFCGVVEAWSVRKRPFSVEGFVALSLMLQFSTSFEWVASVFITSTFQLLIAVILSGLILYYRLGRRGSGGGRTRSVRPTQPRIPAPTPPSRLPAPTDDR